MKKTIIVISNPFCFGPTGKAAEIIEALRRCVKHDRLVYIGSGLCTEIISGDGVTMKMLDERDENALAEFFKTMKRLYVVSSQNRFAVRAAKCVDAPSAFLDGLAWFWREIPPEHLIADEIFWVNFPGMSEKSSAVGRPIHLIPAIIAKPNIQHSLRTALLIHLGGVWNPLTKDLPLSYLDMLSQLLTQARFNADKVIIAGGHDAISYLRKKGVGYSHRVTLGTFPHSEFVELIRSARHLVTSAGQSATLEAFANETPVSFLLPMNLSQYALTEMLTAQGVQPQQLQWQSYMTVENNLTSLSEREALERFSGYAEYIIHSKKQSTQLLKDFEIISNNPPSSAAQKAFINQIGVGGADTLASLLCERWQLH